MPELLGAAPIEIYGSTETGAIAMRINKSEGCEWWTPNKSVELKTDGEGALSVRANGVHGDDWLATGDVAKIREDDRFLLQGRKDSIVKVAEKRVSLVEVARRIKETGLADDAVAALYDRGKRPVIAAVVVLSNEGRDALAAMGHGERVKRLFQWEPAGNRNCCPLWEPSYAADTPDGSQGRLAELGKAISYYT